ncbi:hypothetical protein EDB86DRAFT_3244100 [Lactarius hatsudake]|nr:hypothetical protein EDB86DRAFT_3244100 [Lactarius hatsudake]
MYRSRGDRSSSFGREDGVREVRGTASCCTQVFRGQTTPPTWAAFCCSRTRGLWHHSGLGCRIQRQPPPFIIFAQVAAISVSECVHCRTQFAGAMLEPSAASGRGTMRLYVDLVGGAFRPRKHLLAGRVDSGEAQVPFQYSIFGVFDSERMQRLSFSEGGVHSGRGCTSSSVELVLESARGALHSASA